MCETDGYVTYSYLGLHPYPKLSLSYHKIPKSCRSLFWLRVGGRGGVGLSVICTQLYIIIIFLLYQLLKIFLAVESGGKMGVTDSCLH